MQTKPTFILTLLLLSACSTTPLFQPAAGTNAAQVSFSSSMPGSPELLIGIDCKTSRVSNAMIDKRTPTEAAKLIYKIPAGKPVTLFYRNTEIGDPEEIPVTKGSKQGLVNLYRTDIEKKHTADICETRLAFIPEQNKDYEIFFGATKNNECQIFVREVVNSFIAREKKIKTIKTTAIPACN